MPERMRKCGEDVREVLHDGRPTACVGDAALGYINVFTGWKERASACT